MAPPISVGVGTVGEDVSTSSSPRGGGGGGGGGGGNGGGGAFVFHNLRESLARRTPNPDNGGGSVNSDNNDNNDDDDDDDSAGNISLGNYSVDTTQLASSVGSVVRESREAWLRSVTFMKDQPEDLSWDLTFQDPPSALQRSSSSSLTGSFRRSLSGTLRRSGSGGSLGSSKKDNQVKIGSLGGYLAFSKLQVGEVVTKINSKKIGPSYNAARCTDLFNKSLEKEGIVSVQTGNDDGNDTIVQVTVIKPQPNMTCQEMGLGVWFWRGLCIHFIEGGSIFSYTALKVDDELERVNDIEVTKLEPAAFEKIIDELPCEITIEVKRGKQRWTGKFG